MPRAFLCSVLLALAVAARSSAAHTDVPRHLVDGSTPPAVPSALRVQSGGLVMTKVRVVRVKQLRRLVSLCRPGERLPQNGLVVERVGVDGRDITFHGLGSAIEGCDRNPRARAVHPPWCGGAGWRLFHGKVSDPRLDICLDHRGRAVVAFGWINPVARARWIVVDQPGFREVYPVAANLPVRVTTVSLITAPRGTAFHTAQYDSHGVLLVRRTITAVIAG